MSMSPNINDRELKKFREVSSSSDLSKVAVVVEQTEPIPTAENFGFPFFISDEQDTNPAVDEVVLTTLYSGSMERRLNAFGVSCHVEGTASLYVDGNFIYSIRTNPSTSNPEFYFSPYKVVSGLIEVRFKARDNSPVTKVSAFIQGTDI